MEKIQAQKRLKLNSGSIIKLNVENSFLYHGEPSVDERNAAASGDVRQQEKKIRVLQRHKRLVTVEVDFGGS